MNHYIPKYGMHSLALDVAPTPDNEVKVRQACEMRKSDLMRQAKIHNDKLIEENELKDPGKRSKMFHHPALDFEIKIGPESIRINLHGATAKDIFQIGQNFNMIMMGK